MDKCRRIDVRLPEELDDELSAYSKEHCLTVSSVVKIALYQLLRGK